MTCAQCGHDMATGTEACPHCGTRVAGNTSPVTDAPAWTPASGSTAHATTHSEYKFDAQRWTLSDKVAGVASLVVLISLFLPWFSGSYVSFGNPGASSSGSESGTDAHGWLWLVFVVALAILAYLALTAGFRVLPFSLRSATTNCCSRPRASTWCWSSSASCSSRAPTASRG